MSLMCTIGTLNPRAHYVSGMGLDQLNALRTVFERMIDLDTAATVLSEAQTFCANASFFFKPPHPENGGWWQNIACYASF
jgi:hypothetical protein